MFKGQIVDIVDMNKLREEGKKKTVSVDQFETRNLVFIDEATEVRKGESLVGNAQSSGQGWFYVRVFRNAGPSSFIG